jgi:hypothetical protein
VGGWSRNPKHIVTVVRQVNYRDYYRGRMDDVRLFAAAMKPAFIVQLFSGSSYAETDKVQCNPASIDTLINQVRLGRTVVLYHRSST